MQQFNEKSADLSPSFTRTLSAVYNLNDFSNAVSETSKILAVPVLVWWPTNAVSLYISHKIVDYGYAALTSSNDFNKRWAKNIPRWVVVGAPEMTHKLLNAIVTKLPESVFQVLPINVLCADMQHVTYRINTVTSFTPGIRGCISKVKEITNDVVVAKTASSVRETSYSTMLEGAADVWHAWNSEPAEGGWLSFGSKVVSALSSKPAKGVYKALGGAATYAGSSVLEDGAKKLIEDNAEELDKTMELKEREYLQMVSETLTDISLTTGAKFCLNYVVSSWLFPNLIHNATSAVVGEEWADSIDTCVTWGVRAATIVALRQHLVQYRDNQAANQGYINAAEQVENAGISGLLSTVRDWMPSSVMGNSAMLAEFTQRCQDELPEAYHQAN